MVMGRMVYNFTSQARLLGIKAWRFTLYFVLLDILAFIIQAGGASIASGNDKSKRIILLGLHVYMGGVGFQEFFVLIFAYIAFRFSQQIKQENPSRLSQALILLYAEYAVLVLITVSWSIADRPSSNLHFIDSATVFNVVHPGRVMPGKESDFPGRKERKNYFRAGSPGDSSDLLPTIQPAGPASMPEEIAFQPKRQDPTPSYGCAQ
ncbi:MAG: hypothetical protein Q9179_006321 [Wetmoreana sp. 5 TL-2023]